MANNPKKYAGESALSAFANKIKELFVSKTDFNSSLSNKADKSHTHSISDTTNLQSTLDGKVPTSRTINNKPLTANITLSASDVGAAPSSVQTSLNTVSDTLDDHTSNSDIHFTAAERTKLSGIAAGAQVNTITGVKGNSETSYRTGNVNITKANIGLGNVDNTSDANKPISTAQQLAFDEVNDAIDTHTENDDIHVTTTNKTNWNAAHTHSTSAHARTDATKVEDSSTNGNIKINGTETNVYSHPTSGVTAGTYKSVTVNAQGHVVGGSNPTTLSGFGITDGALKSDVTNHNTSTSAHGDIRELITGLTTRLNTLANSDDTTLDQMSEIVAYIKNNKSLIDGITTNKVNVADIVNNLTTNVTNKPLSASQGVAIKTLIDALDSALDTHDANTTKHITSTERTNWNTAKTHADSAHAPSDAQKNQNAFSNVKVGSTTIAADTTTDTLELVGSNVTITPDATNDKVTIAVADGTTSAKGVVQLTNSTSSTSTTTAATPNSVKSAYDLANTAKTNAATAQSKADSAYTLAENKVDSLSDLGITATATELNYMDGVTSNVQTQLDSKADASTLIGRAGEGNGAEIFNDYTNNTATGREAHAEGYSTTASGMRSHAEGQSSTASAQATHAEGYNTQATATAAHSEGYYTEATGKYSHAEGYMSKAQEQYAHAEGYSNTASGEASHAEGYATWADGNYSHTEGSTTTASGDYSHAEGFYVEAAGRYQHVQGKYNIIDEDASGAALDTYAHIVGNGTSNTKRSNAHTIDWNGNGWFAGDLYVGGISQSDTNASKVITEADQRWNLLYDSGEISAIANSISNIDVSGYTNIQVLVRIYNDGDSVGSRAGSAIFKCANGKNYQFPVWANMFSKSINTVYVMATFNLVDGWLICPCASRLIGDATTFEDTEGGTAGSLAPTGSGMMKCTSPLSTLTISSLDQNSNYYFGMGSRVMVWGWNA